MNLGAFPLLFRIGEISYVKGLAVMPSRFWLRGGGSRLNYLQTKLARRRVQATNIDFLEHICSVVSFGSSADARDAIDKRYASKRELSHQTMNRQRPRASLQHGHESAKRIGCHTAPEMAQTHSIRFIGTMNLFSDGWSLQRSQIPFQTPRLTGRFALPIPPSLTHYGC